MFNKNIIFGTLLVLLGGCSDESLQSQIEGKKWKLVDHKSAPRYFIFSDSGLIACKGRGWYLHATYKFVGESLKIQTGPRSIYEATGVAVKDYNGQTMLSYIVKNDRKPDSEGKVMFYSLSDSDQCHFDENTKVRL